MNTHHAFFLLLLTSFSLSARQYNYRDIPVGERSFGMGTTTMAVPGDVGATLYNPAIMSFQESTQISASVTSYMKIDAYNNQNVSAFRSAAGSISENTFNALPALVGGSFAADDYSWGGGLFVPRFFSTSSSLSGQDGQSGSYSSEDEAVWLGAFGAKRLGRWGLGLSLFYVSHGISEKFLYLSESPVTFDILEYNLETNVLVSVLGVTRRLGSRTIIGLGVRTPFWVLGGTGSILESSTASPSRDVLTIKAKRFSEPWRASAGISYQWSESFVTAFDLHYYGPNIGKLADTDRKEYDIRARGIPNASVGLEYKAWDWIALRWGFFTNLSSAFHLPSTLTAINDRIHLFATTGALVVLRETGSVSLGGYLMGGQGKMADVVRGTGDAVPRSLYMYAFTVASTFKF